MLFNSLEYFIFFPVVLLFYFRSGHKYRWLILLLSSCIFYAAFIPAYLLVLFSVIIVDYFAAIAIEKCEGVNRKRYLILSICVTCLVLFVFKYFNFFSFNIHRLSVLLGWNYSTALLSLALPIGLSFHTFQSLSYVIEVYRGNQKAETHFGIYSLYVMFFPQLVAGPIERPQNLLHQFHEKQAFTYKGMVLGLRLILLGLFKKMVIADNLASYVDEVYSQPGIFGGNMSLLAVYLFAIQIYCDFSGYSDIAIGSARCMGFKLMKNFDHPYFSSSITEFWRRWHISLSTWFRDYVYIPLGGSKKGEQKWIRNMLVVFLLSGLWHGAGWTFITWGLLHAIYVILERKLGLGKKKWNNVGYKILAACITFHLVSFAWIFFRANSMQNAVSVIESISFDPATFFSQLNVLATHIGSGTTTIANWQYSGYMLVIFFVFELLYRKRGWAERLELFPRAARWVLYYGIVAFIFFFGVYKAAPDFIYFQF